MQIDEIKVENGWLMLRTPDTQEALRLKLETKPGNYDVVRHREKRSNNANAYAWALMEKLAERLHMNVLEVYRSQIRNIPGKAETIFIRDIPGAFEKFRDEWTQGHLGRQAAIAGANNGWIQVIVMAGSSDYNTQQMSQLIDSITQDCLALGIETKDPEYVRALLESWKP